jgi:hypothetical protein
MIRVLDTKYMMNISQRNYSGLESLIEIDIADI